MCVFVVVLLLLFFYALSSRGKIAEKNIKTCKYLGVSVNMYLFGNRTSYPCQRC